MTHLYSTLTGGKRFATIQHETGELRSSASLPMPTRREGTFELRFSVDERSYRLELEEREVAWLRDRLTDFLERCRDDRFRMEKP